MARRAASQQEIQIEIDAKKYIFCAERLAPQQASAPPKNAGK